MPIHPHISPRLIPNIASLYNDVNRIFMEYIDNSLDSAEQFFNQETGSYLYPIEISLTIIGNNYKDGRVIVSDNCFGITNFTKVVESIGNSDKKADYTTNGRFGYGIYSFMAAADTLEITSKLKNRDALYLSISKEQFDADHQEDVDIQEPKVVRNFTGTSGTVICLSKFDKQIWREIDILSIKDEIEKHFELLLSRKNLSISLLDKNGTTYFCQPFDYNQYEGDVYDESVGELFFTKGTKNPQETKIVPGHPLKIYIKVTNGKTINKSPVFIAKGRRIAEIKDVRAFKSNHKSDLWGHPNVTGYIDLVDFVDPTIARTDFTNNNNSRALFETLSSAIEPLIFERIKQSNKQSEERHYKELEDRLNQALSKIAKLDNMMYRTDYLSGNRVNLQPGGAGQEFGSEEGSKDTNGTKIKQWLGGLFGQNEGSGAGVEEGDGLIPGGEGGIAAKNKEAENPFEDTGFKGEGKKRSGFNIRIVDLEPDIDEATNKQLRSNIYGNEIRIFKKHPDFLERVKEFRSGEKKITPRLITYLAGEITVHYKDMFQKKRSGGQPEYNKELFIDLVSSVYFLENLLTDLEGKNLSDL